jgi:hypothetical protein
MNFARCAVAAQKIGFPLVHRQDTLARVGCARAAAPAKQGEWPKPHHQALAS